MTQIYSHLPLRFQCLSIPYLHYHRPVSLIISRLGELPLNSFGAFCRHKLGVISSLLRNLNLPLPYPPKRTSKLLPRCFRLHLRAHSPLHLLSHALTCCLLLNALNPPTAAGPFPRSQSSRGQGSAQGHTTNQAPQAVAKAAHPFSCILACGVGPSPTYCTALYTGIPYAPLIPINFSPEGSNVWCINQLKIHMCTIQGKIPPSFLLNPLPYSGYFLKSTYSHQAWVSERQCRENSHFLSLRR